MTGILNIKFQGLSLLQNRLGNVVTKEKVERALDMAALLVESDAKQLVRVDTGRLRASINTIRGNLVRRVGSSVQYAAAQEFGRPDLAKYGYTPYLRPAARKNKQKILSLIKEAIKQ